MKKYQVLTILILVLMNISITSVAQSIITFGYDATGNRINREIILLKNRDATEADLNEIVDELSDVTISISPNPNGGCFKVTLSRLPESKAGQIPVQLMLHNISGESISQIEVLQATNEIDISNHPNGMYILTIMTTDEKRTWKVVKQ